LRTTQSTVFADVTALFLSMGTTLNLDFDSASLGADTIRRAGDSWGHTSDRHVGTPRASYRPVHQRVSYGQRNARRYFDYFRRRRPG
jgi:hypothetical protein